MAGKFWKFRDSVSGEPELLLYGEISGESLWGDEVTAKQFAADLRDAGDPDALTVRINSPGGDVFAAQAIGNLLEASRARVTCRIDGLCASAATIIACHCDRVIAASDSVYMIHPVQIRVGQVDRTGLEQAMQAYDAVRETVVGLYARKTGRAENEVAALMDATTWWTADEARQNGFIDEVESNSGAVLEDRNGAMFINGIDMHLKYEDAPEFVQSCVQHITEQMEGREVDKITGTEKITTADELKAQYPELCAQLVSDAVKAERNRIQTIDESSIEGCEAIAEDAKYGHPVSAAEFAQNALRHIRETRADALTARVRDAEAGGANAVAAVAPSQESQDEFLAALKRMQEDRK